MTSEKLVDHARDVLVRCRDVGLRVTTAESCTGGLIAACLTEIAGSSEVFERGFVTYSNEAKTDLLGVPQNFIEEHGAVSELVARAMAEGALERSNADIAVSVTGVAGPGGGSAEKPVGLVHLACAREGHPTLHRRCEFGDQDRRLIRELSVQNAFEMIEEQIGIPMIA